MLLFVLCIENQAGDIRVYPCSSRALAVRELLRYVAEQWECEMDGPVPEEFTGKHVGQYFEQMLGSESWNIESEPLITE